MFERYEEKARRVIFFARYETSALGGDYIEPEHLLLGLFREWQWLKATVGSQVIEQLRLELERRAGSAARHPTSVDLPLSIQSKRALAYAAEEAERLQSKHIGCGHLACGILRQTDMYASQWLVAQGLTLERMRESLLKSAPPAAANTATVRALEAILENASERLDWTVEPALYFLLK